MTQNGRSACPFVTDDPAAYAAWRSARLASAPRSIDEIRVHVDDLECPTVAERAAIGSAIARSNMVLYTAPRYPDERLLRLALARLLTSYGLVSAETHRSAERDGFVAIEVSDTPAKRGFIPYTSRPLNWHTDGYYNPPSAPICAMLLHCVTAAPAGGDNALLDPEIAYIRLRDADPRFAAALMHPEAMTIPAAIEEDGVERPASTGPVFMIEPESGALIMRYTARTRSITWRATSETREAVAFLADMLSAGTDPNILRVRLAPGEGILCNNVLHARTGFEDGSDDRRRLLRARFRTRIAMAEQHS